MTKFFLWVVGEDVNQDIDCAAKIAFNVMMLGASSIVGACLIGFGCLISLCL